MDEKEAEARPVMGTIFLVVMAVFSVHTHIIERNCRVKMGRVLPSRLNCTSITI